ncbi:hypothetical protein ACC702_38060, partial [Rhizobium ruizarguesonis]
EIVPHLGKIVPGHEIENLLERQDAGDEDMHLQRPGPMAGVSPITRFSTNWRTIGIAGRFVSSSRPLLARNRLAPCRRPSIATYLEVIS